MLGLARLQLITQLVPQSEGPERDRDFGGQREHRSQRLGPDFLNQIWKATLGHSAISVEALMQSTLKKRGLQARRVPGGGVVGRPREVEAQNRRLVRMLSQV